MPALEEAWRQVTGQPLPRQVRDYITSHQDQAKAPEGQRMTDHAAEAARSAAVILTLTLAGTYRSRLRPPPPPLLSPRPPPPPHSPPPPPPRITEVVATEIIRQAKHPQE